MTVTIFWGVLAQSGRSLVTLQINLLSPLLTFQRNLLPPLSTQWWRQRVTLKFQYNSMRWSSVTPHKKVGLPVCTICTFYLTQCYNLTSYSPPWNSPSYEKFLSNMKNITHNGLQILLETCSFLVPVVYNIRKISHS